VVKKRAWQFVVVLGSQDIIIMNIDPSGTNGLDELGERSPLKYRGHKRA
jgi:hypothetical protein